VLAYKESYDEIAVAHH